MNPYSPTIIRDLELSRKISFLPFFAATAYLTYVASMMVHRGPFRVIDEYAQAPIGAAIEACILLGVSYVAAWVSELTLNSRLVPVLLKASRVGGGFVFGLTFITCQPYLFPLARYVLNPMEGSPFERPAGWVGTLLYKQPYVLLPTIVCAGIATWIGERLIRGIASHTNSTNHGIHGNECLLPCLPSIPWLIGCSLPTIWRVSVRSVNLGGRSEAMVAQQPLQNTNEP